jgi:ABC-type Fe3+ transport system substrate-binding protein
MRLLALAAIALSATLTACAPAAQPAAQPAASASTASAAQPARSPEVERLLAAARANGETELNLAWAEDTLGGLDGTRKLEALFNRLYGTSIKINFTPGDLNDTSGRVSQEAAAGQRAFTDVLLGAETHYGRLINTDVLEAYDYTQLSPRVTKDLVVSGNIAVEIASRGPGITYNTNLVPASDVPKRLPDVLDPRWTGKITTTPSGIAFDGIAFRPEWGPEKMKEFMTRYSQQVGGILRVVEQQRIASGEFAMMVMNSGPQEVRKLQTKGAPVAHSLLEDAIIVSFYYLGVPRTSGHPNLAKLFIGMVMSEEGQRVGYEVSYLDHYLLPGSQTAAEFAELRARGMTPLPINAQFIADHPEIRQLRDDIGQILIQRRGG